MVPNPTFVIEHLEPSMAEWSVIEYRHLAKLVGRNSVWFTNIPSKKIGLEAHGRCMAQSIKDLKLHNACILDPEAHAMLTPEIAARFDFFIFGGILGDHPPKKRTKEQLSRVLKLPVFHIGKDQMSTDNAVAVVKEIIAGKRLDELEFQEGLTIEIDSIQSTDLPYKYLLVDGKPFVSKELIDYIRKKDRISNS